eukprot:TRINITY_DN7033_c0_g1_i1.p1 TRINITY_DN7033_c0_g1~~TRINITY_DN7033_c0_g1_i1.p1  ORF type:complete len:687 (-),score=177.65 TRINITY_DN7033_c0_g1_i1:93-2153(-)
MGVCGSSPSRAAREPTSPRDPSLKENSRHKSHHKHESGGAANGTELPSSSSKNPLKRESTTNGEQMKKLITEPSTKPKNKASRKVFYLLSTALGIYLSETELAELSNIFEMNKYNANLLLYRQGERAHTLYVVGAGEMKLFVDLRGIAEDKEEDPDAFLESIPRESRFIVNKGIGDVFGQEALFADIDVVPVRAGSMKVTHKAEMMSVPIALLREHLKNKNDPMYEARVLAGLGADMRSLLPKTNMFKDADVDLFRHPILWTMFRWKNIGANETLFEEGSIGKALYVVYEGTLTIELSGKESSRSRTVVAEIKKGDTLGEIAMLIDAPRSGTVTAKVPSSLLELSVEEFNCLLDHFPGVARRITEIARKHVVYNFRKYRIPFFQSLNEEQYNLLGQLCSVQQIPPGEIIFDYGDYGDRFYMIAHGDVGIFVPKEEKKQMEKANDGDGVDIKVNVEVAGQIEVCRIGPGRYFGELALVTDAPRGATARAHTKCVILSITRAKFVHFFEKHPEAGADFQIKLAKYQIKMEQLLAHPRGCEYFLKHCKSEYSEENIQFYLAVKELESKASKMSQEEFTREASSIVEEYVSESSSAQVNLSGDMKKNLVIAMKAGKLDSHSFVQAKKEIFDLMMRDSFPRFKSSPLFQEFLREMEAYDYVQTEKHLEQHPTGARQVRRSVAGPDPGAGLN